MEKGAERSFILVPSYNNTEASLSIYRLSFKIKGMTQTLISLPLAHIKVYCILTVNWKLTKTT